MRLGLGNTLALTNNGSSNPDALSLNLDFATDKSFSKPTTVAAGETVINARKGPSPVFSRASGGTMVGSDGLIQYSPENLLTYSQQFENTSGWLQTLGSAISNTIVAPDGSLTGDTLKANAVSYGGILRRAVNVPYTTSTQYTFSIYAKAGTKSTLGVRVSGYSSSTSGNYFSYFSLTGSGSATILAPQDAGTINSMTCTAVGDGWYKCVMTYTTAEALVGDTTDLCITTTTGQTNYTPADTDTIYIWGAQVERSSTARQYIPTTTAVVYGPRFDHEPLSPFACKGLLIEEQSENILSYSEDYTNALWVKVASTVSTSPSVSPAGGSCKRIKMNAGSSQYPLYGTPYTTVISRVVTTSAYVRYVNAQWLWIFVGDTVNCWASFDIQNKVIGGKLSGITSHNIIDVGNGWCRISATMTETSVINGGGVTFRVGNASTPTNSNTTQIGTEQFDLWGAQLEAKAFPTSYIPTTSGTASRSADLCSITGSAFTNFYNQSAGTIVAGVYSAPKPIAGTGNWIVHTGTSAGVRTFDMYNADPTTLRGTGDIAITTISSFPSKMALAQTNLDFQGCFNGTLGGTSTVLSMGVSANMHFGNWNTQTRFLNGCISSIKYYKKRLTNAKLQSLTAP